MLIIKEKILSNGVDTNININLGGNVKVLGYQQEIDNLTEETKNDLVNPINDNEVRRFRYTADNPSNILFYFTTGSSHYNSFGYNGARFTGDEINSYNLKILNSFFILDFYDTYESYTQTKIFTSYLTKISGKHDIDSNNYNKPFYRLWSDIPNQWYNLNIPNSYLLNQTGSTITGYVKFSFFNAKYGDISLFYNNDNQSLQTQEKMYFKVLLNLDDRTWKFDYYGISFPPNVKAYQIPLTNTYSKKINDTVETFNKEKQSFPSGNIFNDATGGYDNDNL